ncbi:hypothetical protein KP79_PYT19987 [Mizuhopecten yessoensis]|uniref:ParB/Sulfiredoxin domain-containing protein n=1 Tax=Mizuhopecten yessoensis TaxID=6573 RepID=A0A210PVN1_MIZYE|nr:hypothetical protein KP79_PYT19987 [Mizuhopecten yessoensis]
MATTRMYPSDLRYTHDSVSCRFSNGFCLEETFEKILYDEVRMYDLPCLVAMPYQGKWFVVRGNRRLYIYKQLESAGKISKVDVKCVAFESDLFYRQFSTENSGRSLRIRSRPSMEQHLTQIVRTWVSNGQRRKPVYEAMRSIYSNDSFSYPSTVTYEKRVPRSTGSTMSRNTSTYPPYNYHTASTHNDEGTSVVWCCCKCFLAVLMLLMMLLLLAVGSLHSQI